MLWDLDAAGGAGFLFSLDPRKKHSAGTVFSKDVDPAGLVRKTDVPRLELLPADESLRELDSLLARLGKKRHLAKLAEDLARRYERIILDCPPVRHQAVGAFAPNSPAAKGFGQLWTAIERKLARQAKQKG